MAKDAEKRKKKYLKLNEANGPVFKIRNDPRFTKFGKALSHTGLDELPQFLNVIKGEMSLVGPRPLPPEEEKQIEKKWQKPRRTVKPGLFSSWLAEGAHSLTFQEWMALDVKDIKNSSFFYDLSIILKIIMLSLKLIKDEIFKKNNYPFNQTTNKTVIQKLKE